MSESKVESKTLPVIGCLVVMFSIGIVYLWSVFQQPVIDYYGWVPTSVSLISSVMIFMFLFGSMIGGFIQDKKSPRFVITLGGILFFIGLFSSSLIGEGSPWMMYITYGTIAGIGVGFAYAGSLQSIQKWFPHKRGFASGISVCAFGLSMVAFSPLIEWFLQLPAFGDNAVPLTFRILAVLFTVIIIIAGFFVKNPSPEYVKSLNLPQKFVSKKQYTTKEMFKTGPFWCLAFTTFFLPAAYMMIIPLVKTLAVTRGIPPFQASLTVSLMGVASAVSRLLSGVVSDKLGRAKTVFILAVLAMISAILMIFADGWVYTAVILLVVFAYAGPSSIYPAMSMDVYGEKYSGGNYGMVLLSLGISSPVWTLLSNKLNADGFATGNYTLSFIVAACVCVVPLIALPLFDYFKAKMEKNPEKIQEDNPGK